ncbi:MAG TPA: cyclic nucleotide-binding domain-containing protein [Gaiellaceae bacterium]
MRPEPEQLAAVPLLASLKPQQLQAIATLSELRSEPEGTELAGEGAPGYALFIIIDGTATVTSGDAELATLGPGDFFGEIALLAGKSRRTATVMAASPVTLAVMFGSDFRVFERDFPEASAQMKHAMDERLER